LIDIDSIILDFRISFCYRTVKPLIEDVVKNPVKNCDVAFC